MNLHFRAFILLLLSLLLQNQIGAQPKLVVGIVVDQMRQEYLYRFESKYTEGGFKRMIKEGFMAKNMHYNYVPTYTGPGHASIYTGATPAVHGIIANDWYDRELKRERYCAEDTAANALGGSEDAGKISSRNVLSTTITDELKLSTIGKAKVVAMSIKDRGASIPAGHRPDGAYWYDSKTGEMMSSDYFAKELPQWVKNFNAKKYPDTFLSKPWNPLLPIEQYSESRQDDNAYEAASGKDKPVFPYDLPSIKAKAGYGLLSNTPFGNSFLLQFAKDAVSNESLGLDNISDFLAISFSSPDYIGHAFDPFSIELEDNYLRLDRELADFFTFLDQKVGKGNYTVFLTADHGVADNPQFLRDQNMPAGFFYEPAIKSIINESLVKQFGPGEWIEYLGNDQIFLNRQLLEQSKISYDQLVDIVINELKNIPGVRNAYKGSEMSLLIPSIVQEENLKRGYHPLYSGDVLIMLQPGWFATNRTRTTGTTHSSGYSYDTHVPLLMFGYGIQSKVSVNKYAITDIAPTISTILKMKFPSGCIGNPIGEALK